MGYAARNNAALRAQHLRRATVVAQTAPDVMERLSQFCGERATERSR